MKTDGISRRALFKAGLIAGAAIPVFGFSTRSARAAAGLTPLDTTDPLAKAMGFVNDNSKVDTATNPTYKPTQKCSGCAQYQGKASEASAACTIFAGHSVPAEGWCRVWAKKPGT